MRQHTVGGREECERKGERKTETGGMRGKRREGMGDEERRWERGTL
jgi:hypothetical protein